MAGANLTAQERKHLETLSQLLVYKCIQVIVQSRQGDLMKTDSSVTTHKRDKLPISIPDSPEIHKEIHKVVPKGILFQGQTICVEISLQTAEGEKMILETWWMSLAEAGDIPRRVVQTASQWIVTLLKSLLSYTRACPAHKLARSQGPEQYIMCYRLYTSDPDFKTLGENYARRNVGSVPMPIGTFTISVAYRTCMTMSPQNSTHELMTEVSDDYFNEAGTTLHSVNIPKPCRNKRILADHSDGGVDNSSALYGSILSQSPPDDLFIYSQSPPSDRYYTVARRVSSDFLMPTIVGVGDHAKRVQSDTVVRPSGSNAKYRPKALGEEVVKRSPYLPFTSDGESSDDEATPTGSRNRLGQDLVPDKLSPKAPVGVLIGSAQSKSYQTKSGGDLVPSSSDDFVMVNLKKSDSSSSCSSLESFEEGSSLGVFYKNCEKGLKKIKHMEMFHASPDNNNDCLTGGAFVMDKLRKYASHLPDWEELLDDMNKEEDE